MSLNISSVNSSILQNITSKLGLNNSNTNNDELQKALNKANTASRPTLYDYIDGKAPQKNKKSITDYLSLYSGNNNETGYEQMSGIDKYKYIQAQAQAKDIEYNNVITNPQEALESAEKIIQRTLAQGVSENDIDNLQKALQAKQIALSRLNMLA